MTQQHVGHTYTQEALVVYPESRITSLLCFHLLGLAALGKEGGMSSLWSLRECELGMQESLTGLRSQAAGPPQAWTCLG